MKHLTALQAVSAALVTFALASTGDALSRVLHIQGLSVYQLVFFSNLLPLLFSLSYLHKKQQLKAVFTTPKWKWHIIRGLACALSAGVCVYTITQIRLTDFYGFVFLMPIVVTLCMAIFFRENVRRYHWATLGFGFFGVMIVLGSAFSNPSMAYLVAMLIPFLGGSHMLLARKIGADHFLSFMVWQNTVCAAVYLIPSFYNAPLPALSSLPTLLAYAFFAGCAAFGFGNVYARTPSVSLIAPVQYTQILWGLLFGWWWFNEQPAANTMLGIGVILGTGAMLWWCERNHVRKKLLEAKAEDALEESVRHNQAG